MANHCIEDVVELHEGVKVTKIINSQSQFTDNEDENDFDHDNFKTFGCIPRAIHGDFGCICCPAVKYWINPIVMTLSVTIIWSFVIWCAIDTDNASIHLGEAQSFVVKYFGWFYIISLIIFGIFSTYLVFSKYGDIKLGPTNEEPKYNLLTWFSMLFSAGIGVGLYFWGVAEPVFHFNDMQNYNSRWYHKTQNEQAMEALNLSWFHWGFTASACYCVAALPLAYHHHVKNEPLRESVCFIVLIGHKYANGIIGHLIDLTSVIGTMFGVATSLGLGVLSINSGLKFVFGIRESLTAQLSILWCITIFATISVLTGLDKGIRRLSEINWNFSLIVLFFMFFASDTFFIINLFIQGIGYHFQWILELTFNTQAFEQAGFIDRSDLDGLFGEDTTDESVEKQINWMSSWTVFYWAWWIAWAPFVGIFIAQISRGRTVREFIIGNMMVPTLFTCIWLTVFGGIGLYNELGSIQNDIACDDDVITSTFNDHNITKLSCYSEQDMLWAAIDTLPLSNLIKILSIFGIIIYFVTSSDSASHVIDILTASGNHEPPKLQRIFWALSEGAVASVLLASDKNSLTALQTGSLVAALPFCVVLLFETYATYKTFKIHYGEYPEIDSPLLNFWKYDLFECINKRFLLTLCGVICPPYFQTRTRLKIIQNNTLNDKSDICYNNNYEIQNKCANNLWFAAYWITWFLSILFLFFGIFIDGMIELSLTIYLFYIMTGVINRNNISYYYNINSTNTCYGLLSWIFCWCCAVIQEDIQSNQNISIELKLKHFNYNNNNNNEQTYTIDSPKSINNQFLSPDPK